MQNYARRCSIIYVFIFRTCICYTCTKFEFTCLSSCTKTMISTVTDSSGWWKAIDAERKCRSGDWIVHRTTRTTNYQVADTIFSCAVSRLSRVVLWYALRNNCEACYCPKCLQYSHWRNYAIETYGLFV